MVMFLFNSHSILQAFFYRSFNFCMQLAFMNLMPNQRTSFRNKSNLTTLGSKKLILWQKYIKLNREMTKWCFDLKRFHRYL